MAYQRLLDLMVPVSDPWPLAPLQSEIDQQNLQMPQWWDILSAESRRQYNVSPQL